MTDTYQIHPSRFPYCQGHWDDNTSKFVENNSKENIDCCINNCKDSVKFCLESGMKNFGPTGIEPNYFKYNSNYNACENIYDDCQTYCNSYYSEGSRMILDCAKNNKCNIYPLLDKNCLENKKKDIIDCCKKTYLNDTNEDYNQCEIFFDWVYNTMQDPESKFPNQVQNGSSNILFKFSFIIILI